jgi:hypothetical protein
VTIADAVGNEVVYATRDASVTVEAANPVPEPGTVPLAVLAGLAGLWVRRRSAAVARPRADAARPPQRI